MRSHFLSYQQVTDLLGRWVNGGPAVVAAIVANRLSRHLAPSHCLDRDGMVEAELNCLAGDRVGFLRCHCRYPPWLSCQPEERLQASARHPISKFNKKCFAGQLWDRLPSTSHTGSIFEFCKT